MEQSFKIILRTLQKAIPVNEPVICLRPVTVYVLERRDELSARVKHQVEGVKHFYKKIVWQVIEISYAVYDILHAECGHSSLIVKHPEGVILNEFSPVLREAGIG